MGQKRHDRKGREGSEDWTEEVLARRVSRAEVNCNTRGVGREEERG